jgi:Asp-tRNA(Asn)/Glu-tRNA(Gln) amidotransferase B subunit
LREFNNAGKKPPIRPFRGKSGELDQNAGRRKNQQQSSERSFDEMFKAEKPPPKLFRKKASSRFPIRRQSKKSLTKSSKKIKIKSTAYRGGNEKLFGFFVGQTMKASQRQSESENRQ